MSSSSEVKNDKRRIIFVGGLPSLTTEDMLWKHFSEFAKLTNVKILRDKKTKELSVQIGNTKESKGYAYVTLADPSMVPVVADMKHVLLDRKLDVQLASRKGERHVWKNDQLKRRLFVTGLPEHVEHEDLYSAFRKFGQIHNAYVIVDFETKKLKSYGYVEFEEEESANYALAEPVFIRGIQINACTQKDSKTQFQQPAKSPVKV